MKNNDYSILLVDDEPDIIEFLSYNLINEGYNVFAASNGKEGIEMVIRHNPHLVIMDVMMPEIDGIEACEQIKALGSQKNTIVALLSARAEDYSQIAGFKAGADDYITKPFRIKLLMSRIRALLKRYPIRLPDKPIEDLTYIIKYGNLEIDKEKHIVYIDEKELLLPKKVFSLLVLLLSKPGKVFTREEIFSQIWDNNVIVGGRTIDVHIRKLREKIGNHHILTIKGIGYKFVD